jgi:hypothetical protein
VQTLCFTQTVRLSGDSKISTSTEHLVASPEEAHDAGAAPACLVAAFMDGFGDQDTSAWESGEATVLGGKPRC